MFDTGKRVAVLATLLLAACGPGPDFTVHGTDVVVRSDAAFAKQPDFPARIETTIESALTYWGGSWKDLEGSTIAFEGSQHVSCEGTASAIGCYDGDIRVSTKDAGSTLDCVEETALVHEVGHAVIGDPEHADPRWLDFGEVAGALAGRRGYHGGEETACPIFVSLWRHPPDHRKGT